MNNSIAIAINAMFQARELAHFEHLNTSSYAAHVALGDFYEEIIGIADALAENFLVANHSLPRIEVGLQSTDFLKQLSELLTIAVNETKDEAEKTLLADALQLTKSTMYKTSRLK